LGGYGEKSEGRHLPGWGLGFCWRQGIRHLSATTLGFRWRREVGASPQLSGVHDLCALALQKCVVPLPAAERIDGFDHVETRDTLAEDDVRAVQVVSRRACDAEVRGVGVVSAVGDGEQVRSVVLQLQAARVVLEWVAVDAHGVHTCLVDKPV